MGCSQSKPEDVDGGNAALSESQRSTNRRYGLDSQLSGKIAQGAKNVKDGVVNTMHKGADLVNANAIKPVGMIAEKVASLAIAVPQTLGAGIRTHAHHLKNVFVPPINPDDLRGFTLPVYPKSDEERQFILKVLSESFIFANLEDNELRSIVDAFEKKSFDEGSEILLQGDTSADYFYVVHDGVVVYIVDGKEVGSSSGGSSFGELALLYSSPRAATVKAKGDCVTFRVDQKSFRSVLQQKNMQTAEEKLALLKKVDFLADMEIFDLQKLSSAMTPVTFEPGDFLVKKGDTGDAFFLIQEGEVRVTDIAVGASTYEDTTLGVGGWFGERALITREPRAANVIGNSSGIAMSIDKDTFDKVLGNMSSLIVKSQEKRILVSFEIMHFAACSRVYRESFC